MATRPRTENNPFAYGMRLLAVFYNEMEKNKDKISANEDKHAEEKTRLEQLREQKQQEYDSVNS